MQEVASRLRGMDKPVLLVANKVDTSDFIPQTAEFHKLGFGDITCVSAQQNRGKTGAAGPHSQRSAAQARLEPKPSTDEPLKLAIVGRRNAGKSTFINCLAEEERAIVSEVDGTTRDSIDVRFQKDGKEIIAIDTAGVRNKGTHQDERRVLQPGAGGTLDSPRGRGAAFFRRGQKSQPRR